MSVNLVPKDTHCTYSLLTPPPAPLVRIRRNVLNDMANLVDLAKGEVGWFCTVIDHGIKDGRPVFELDGVYLFEQKVHGATTEISAESISKISYSMLEEDNWDADKRVNRMYCWGHSHVEMETHPSSQDDKQMDTFGENNDVFIRLIANKKGDVRIDVYFYKQGIALLECPWDIVEVENRNDFWKTQMDSMVSQIVLTPKKGTKTEFGNFLKGRKKTQIKKPQKRGKFQSRGRMLKNLEGIGGFFDEEVTVNPSITSELQTLINSNDQSALTDPMTTTFALIVNPDTDKNIISEALTYNQNDWVRHFSALGYSATDSKEYAQNIIETLRASDLID